MLNRLSIDKILTSIQREEKFRAITEDGAFLISIEEYVPFICCAIHNGGNFRDSIRNKLALTKMDRWSEEDPFTWAFIDSLPIELIVYDSRYEYDLNREESEAIYEEAWGKSVWREKLTPKEREESLQKHRNFYLILDALIEKLESKFSASIIYDIHSYNYKRGNQNSNLPVFNVGTEKIEDKRYRKFINRYLQELKGIDLEPIENITKENGVFFGRGYLLSHIMKKFKNSLVLATEIKKIYVDEDSADEYPEIIDKLKVGLKRAFVNTAYYFVKSLSSIDISHKYQLLSSLTEDTLKVVDRELFELLNKLEILTYVNPMNIESERKKFLNSKFKREPHFKYRPLNMNLQSLKRRLYQIRIDKIKDITLQNLYQDIIDETINRFDLLQSRDSEEFLYNSLKIYSKPDRVDLENAKYLLYCSDYEVANEQELSSIEVKKILEDAIDRYGFSAQVKIVKNLSANAMVLNSTKSVQLKKDATFSKTYAMALSHHEVGIHLLTTMNALVQPLKILRVGTTKNTTTQEGLAIMSEYLSGTLTLSRLKELAIRVIAVDKMVKGADFLEIFSLLRDEYCLDESKAFQVATRVLRGGGFTKDYVYLRGFKMIYKLYKESRDLTPLLIGKTSLEYKLIFKELIERGILKKPLYTPESFNMQRESEPILDYILKGLK